MRRTLYTIAAIGASLAVAVTPALAGRSSSSVSLVVLASAGTLSSTAAVGFGSDVTFNVATDATSYPWVEVQCSQAGKLVYAQTRGFFDSYYTAPTYELGPTPSWSSGSANCTATLFSSDGSKRHNLASTSFNVG
jgi:hypothetical protein